MLPNAEMLRVIKVGNVPFETCVDGDVHVITLSNAYNAPFLSKDLRLTSYGLLKKN